MTKTVKGKAGAPQKPVFVPRGKFTVEQAYQLNVEKKNQVCLLTVRKFVDSAAVGYRIVKKNGVEKKIKVDKILTRLGEVAKKATVGRPNFLYIRDTALVAKLVSKPAVKAPKVVKVKAAAPAPAVAVPVTVVPSVTPPVASPANTDPVSY